MKGRVTEQGAQRGFLKGVFIENAAQSFELSSTHIYKSSRKFDGRDLIS